MKIGDPDWEAPGAQEARQRRNDEAITPGRDTRVFFDVPDFTLRQGFWGGVRTGNQVNARAAQQQGRDATGASTMRYWPGPDCWTLSPVQERQADYQESLPSGVAAADITYTPGVLDLPVPLVPVPAKLIPMPVWTNPVGSAAPGILAAPSVAQAPVDVVSVKQVPANSQWNGALTASRPAPTGTEAQVTGGSGSTTLKLSHFPMDCLYAPPGNVRADQGFYLSWNCPGSASHHPDFVLSFYFGQYCLTIGGNGLAYLTEWCRPKGGGSGSERWVQRFTFRYSRPAQVVNIEHALLIFPVLGVHGERYLCFSGGQTDGATSSPMDVCYEASRQNRGTDQNPAGPENVTIAAPIRLDVRRDLRPRWKVQRLVFPYEGLLYDDPWSPPETVASAYRFSPRMRFRAPADAQNEATIRAFVSTPPLSGDAQVVDQYECKRSGNTVTESHDTHKGKITVRFTFTAGGVIGSGGSGGYYLDTPILYGYALRRNPATAPTAPEPIFCQPSGVSFSCMGMDPKQDSGLVTLEDPTGAMLRLANRGEAVCKITTAMDGLDPASGDEATQSLVTLFFGDAARIRRSRRLWHTPHRGFAGPPADYPSPDWSEYTCTLAGMYRRAAEINTGVITLKNFAQDLDAPFNTTIQAQPPWKITDIIRYLLRCAGFPLSQVEIADSPIRLWSSGQDKSQDDLWYTPNTRILDQCVRLARIYLGANLIYDLGAGPLAGSDRADAGSPIGAWKLVYSPEEGATPLIDFVTEQPEGKAGVGARVWGAGKTFISGKPQSYVVAPECNHFVIMTGFKTDDDAGTAVRRDVYNYKSYDVPGATVAADPESPHYLGRERLYIHVDPTLFVEAGEDRLTYTQAAVDLVAWRLLNFAGRAQRILPFRAPLMIVEDPATGRKRIPRWGDCVSVNGDADWFVRSCSPDYGGDGSDYAQMAEYELLQLVPLTE